MNFFYLNSVIFLVLSMLCSEALGQKCSPNACLPGGKPICAFNKFTNCYEDFSSECERRRFNCGRKPNERFITASNGKCDEFKCLIPLCCGKTDCSKETDKRAKCGKSTSEPSCFKQFGNECLWRKWNCDNPKNTFTKERNGPCGKVDQPLCK